MGRSARMLTAVLVALVATLLAAAAPASAIKVKVRVETNRSISLIYQGFVDRTLVDLPDGGPPVEVSGGTCASNSPIAALKTALASLPAPLPFAAQVDATQGGKVTQIGTVDTTKPALGGATWAIWSGGVPVRVPHATPDPCGPISPTHAESEILAFLKCGPTSTPSVPCFRGLPAFVRQLGDGFYPVVPIITHQSLPIIAVTAGEDGGTTPSASALLMTDEGVSIGTDQIRRDGSARVNFTTEGPHVIAVSDSMLVDGKSVLAVPDRIPVCITNGGDGFCGTTKDPHNDFIEPPSPCDTNGADGLCGTTDTTGPAVEVTNLKDKQVFKPKKGPTVVRGNTNVARDPNGIRDVRVRLTRVVTQKVKVKPKRKRKAKKSSAHGAAAGHPAVAAKKKAKKKVRYRKRKVCTYWSDDTLLLERAKRCGAAGGRWFTADLSDLRDTFKYDFAMKLPKGTYLLEVQSADENGSPDPRALGRNVLKFVVK